MNKPGRVTKIKYLCETCAKTQKNFPEMNPEDIKAHLKEVHKITDLKGTRETVLCLDGADWYSNTYLIKIGDVEISQCITNEN